MPKLGVNIDHIATLRQQRKIGYPSIIEAAKILESCGVDQITVHLREDRRHIQDEDVIQLKKILKIPLNLEMSLNKKIVDFALKVKPKEVCIVPERRQELTTEGGLDLEKNYKKVKSTIFKLKQENICVSLFIEPQEKSVKLAKELGADAVEIHTGKYSLCKIGTKKFYNELDKIKKVSKIVLKEGLILNAGHGLDYNNVKYIAEIEGINTLNIGFSIISRAVFVGLRQAAEEMLSLSKG
ncbi:MAG: pyridoxine 5'-phosphate synthase [Endomicrobiia bacterium]